MRKIPFTSKLSVMTVSILLLSACGGGGSSHSVNDVTPVTPVTPTTPVATTPSIANPKKSTLLTATGMTKCGNDLINDLACNTLSADFKGLQQDGEVKAGTAMNYKLLNQNGGECVQDLATGLIWEQKPMITVFMMSNTLTHGIAMTKKPMAVSQVRKMAVFVAKANATPKHLLKSLMPKNIVVIAIGDCLIPTSFIALWTLANYLL